MNQSELRILTIFRIYLLKKVAKIFWYILLLNLWWVAKCLKKFKNKKFFLKEKLQVLWRPSLKQVWLIYYDSTSNVFQWHICIKIMWHIEIWNLQIFYMPMNQVSLPTFFSPTLSLSLNEFKFYIKATQQLSESLILDLRNRSDTKMVSWSLRVLLNLMSHQKLFPYSNMIYHVISGR